MTPNQDKRRILKARALALARPVAVADGVGASIEIIEFALANERYGLETACLREVCTLKDLTPLPCTPAFVAGVINVRGSILPVIDISQFLELPIIGLNDVHVVLIVRADDTEIGILADRILGIGGVPLASLQPSLPTLARISADYVKGVTAERLVVLDAARIALSPRIIVNEEAETDSRP